MLKPIAGSKNGDDKDLQHMIFFIINLPVKFINSTKLSYEKNDDV
jgi:hypothetical protein